MLALYDADTNALQDGRLLRRPPSCTSGCWAASPSARCAECTPGEPERQLPALVEQELRPAVGRGVRDVQPAGGSGSPKQELDADLAALASGRVRAGHTEASAAPLTAGEELVGRFFFIQRSQAPRSDDRTCRRTSSCTPRSASSSSPA